MFLCDACHRCPNSSPCWVAVQYPWSVGPCESCGKSAFCFDCKSDHHYQQVLTKNGREVSSKTLLKKDNARLRKRVNRLVRKLKAARAVDAAQEKASKMQQELGVDWLSTTKRAESVERRLAKIQEEWRSILHPHYCASDFVGQECNCDYERLHALITGKGG